MNEKKICFLLCSHHVQVSTLVLSTCSERQLLMNSRFKIKDLVKLCKLCDWLRINYQTVYAAAACIDMPVFLHGLSALTE